MQGSPEEFVGVLQDLEGLDEGELRAQIERASQITAMTQHPGWALLVDYLTAQSVGVQRRVLGGYCDSMDEYRSQTGLILGMKAAIDAPAKLVDRIRKMQEQAELAKEPSDSD